jgi:hypothetical protein
MRSSQVCSVWLARGVSGFATVRATISGADHSFCTAALCSARLGRRGFAFPCVALPCRHCSTASTALGRQPKCVGDQLFGRFLSLVHFAALLLARVSLSIYADWYRFGRHSWFARFSDDSLGKPTRRTFLHSEPLARIDPHVGNRRTFCVRLVARHAFRQRRVSRSALVDHGLWDAAFTGSRCRIDWLLSGLLRWSAAATHAP